MGARGVGAMGVGLGCLVRDKMELVTGIKTGVAFLFHFRSSYALDTFYIPSPCRPDLLDFESLKKCNAHYNLQNAFNLAEKELGLTKLLDPEGGAE